MLGGVAVQRQPTSDALAKAVGPFPPAAGDHEQAARIQAAQSLSHTPLVFAPVASTLHEGAGEARPLRNRRHGPAGTAQVDEVGPEALHQRQVAAETFRKLETSFGAEPKNAVSRRGEIKDA